MPGGVGGGQYLGDNNVAVRRSTTFDERVQDKLRNLGGFSTACCSSDEHHRVTVDGGQYHLFKLFDGQLVTFPQHLQKKAGLMAPSVDQPGRQV